MNFEPTIGIEIHVEQKTKSKMFSKGPVEYGALPNSRVDVYDMAFPGTIPSVNKQAVINGIRVANALGLEIDHELIFARKNYFYSDLTKGYQISQDDRPLGKNGFLKVVLNNETIMVEIERMHLEEDTAKQIHLASETLVDYNRAVTPLLEIVTKPCITSAEAAYKYVEGIRQIVTYLDVSDGKMEEGSLRCDINISIHPYGSKTLGTKVECKNLNSLANVRAAIEYEVKRQTALILSGQEVIQETRRYDEHKKATVLMRVKTDAVDYKYFTDDNILPIRLSDKFIEDAIKSSNELPEVKYSRYIKLGLNDYEASQLLLSKDMSTYFDKAALNVKGVKTLWNFLMVDVMGYLNATSSNIIDFKLPPEYLAELALMVEANEINSKQAKDVFQAMVTKLESPKVIAKELGVVQENNEDVIQELVTKVISLNPQAIIDYKNGKDRAVGFLVGQVMKESHGKANPTVAHDFVLAALEEAK